MTIMGALGWIVSIVGVLGVGGFVALVIFAPVIAGTVARGVLEFVSKIWATRIGMAAIVATVCLLVGGLYGDYQGASRVQARWDAARARAAAEVRAADNEAARKAEATDQQTETTEKTEDKAIEETRNELEKRNDAGCTADDPRDLERLRKLR